MQKFNSPRSIDDGKTIGKTKKQEFSPALIQRLKRCGRCFKSPVISKTVTELAETSTPSSTRTISNKASRITGSVSPERKKLSFAADKEQQTDDAEHVLEEQKQALLASISIKEENLRKLKLVQIYRNKNDLNCVEDLTAKWLEATQTALTDLQNSFDSRPSMTDLLGHFRIPFDVVQYNEDTETFE